MVQQRSPVLKVRELFNYSIVFRKCSAQDRKYEFITALLDFLKSSNFGAVLFLSGVDPLHRNDSQMLCVILHVNFWIQTV